MTFVSNFLLENHSLFFTSSTFFVMKFLPLQVVEKPGIGYRIYTKGASEIVLELCNKMCDQNCVIDSLSHAQKHNFKMDTIEDFARQGLRTLSIAYCDIPLVYI